VIPGYRHNLKHVTSPLVVFYYARSRYSVCLATKSFSIGLGKKAEGLLGTVTWAFSMIVTS
jgi:hypothetical protein